MQYTILKSPIVVASDMEVAKGTVRFPYEGAFVTTSRGEMREKKHIAADASCVCKPASGPDPYFIRGVQQGPVKLEAGCTKPTFYATWKGCIQSGLFQISQRCRLSQFSQTTDVNRDQKSYPLLSHVACVGLHRLP